MFKETAVDSRMIFFEIERLDDSAIPRSAIEAENPMKMLPDLEERLRQGGHKLLLEDYSLDIEEFRERLATEAEKLGFAAIVRHRLDSGELSDPTYHELRQAWKECRHDDPKIDEYEEQIANRLLQLVKVHYANPVADELWSQLRQGFALTDLGCGERLVEEHGESILYCHEQDHFYLWDGKRWVRDTKNWLGAKSKAKETVRRVKAEADETKQLELIKWWKGAESPGRLNTILKSAALSPKIRIAAGEFDSRKWLLNCTNATLHLNRPILKACAHRPQDYLTRIVPWRYDPKAQCRRWMRFLEQVTDGDPEFQHFLQLIVGYGITGDVSQKCLFFLHGPADTGKTTFVETLSTMLGNDYARAAGFTSFVRGVKSGIRNDIARLQGVRFVAASEAAQQDKFDVVLLKKITGDDTVTARLLYREHVEFRPEFKIFLASNHGPQLPADDDAIWRRFIVLPFDVQIQRREHGLRDRLRDEMSGILAWAVQGAWLYYANYFSRSRPLERPKRVQEAIDRYRAQCEADGSSTAEKTNDKAKRLIRRFLDECCERVPGEDVTPEDLLKAAKGWCEEHFEDGAVITPNMLGRVLSQSGFEAVPVTKDRVNMRLWKNIKINM
ncbi:MAG: phage/plasmid primase, P4 family [Syntrophobacteraceae bacterium]